VGLRTIVTDRIRYLPASAIEFRVSAFKYAMNVPSQLYPVHS